MATQMHIYIYDLLNVDCKIWMIQNDCMTTYVDLICDQCFLCTHNSASLGLFPSAPAHVHS